MVSRFDMRKNREKSEQKVLTEFHTPFTHDGNHITVQYLYCAEKKYLVYMVCVQVVWTCEEWFGECTYSALVHHYVLLYSVTRYSDHNCVIPITGKTWAFKTHQRHAGLFSTVPANRTQIGFIQNKLNVLLLWILSCPCSDDRHKFWSLLCLGISARHEQTPSSNITFLRD